MRYTNSINKLQNTSYGDSTNDKIKRFKRQTNY